MEVEKEKEMQEEPEGISTESVCAGAGRQNLVHSREGACVGGYVCVCMFAKSVAVYLGLWE
jgi:hypothetical protein